MPAPASAYEPNWYDDAPESSLLDGAATQAWESGEDYEQEDYLRGCTVQRLPASGVHRAGAPVVAPDEADHEALYQQIASRWLAAANDAAEPLVTGEVLGRLGSLERVPRVSSFARARASAEADHQRAFILDLVDGERTLSGVVVVSSLPAQKVLGALAELLEDGAIALE